MVKDELTIYSISMLLEDVGDILCREPRDTRVLRLMQNKMNELVKDVKDHDVLFITDFLDDYVDKIWFNMAVDFSYEADHIGKDVFNDLMHKIGKNLVNLAQSIRIADISKRNSECYKILRELSIAYNKKLHVLKLKAQILRKNPPHPSKIKNYEIISPTNIELYRVFDKCGVVYQSEHALAGGAESNYFFDIDRILSDPEATSVVSKYYIKKINEIEQRGYRIDKLAFIDKDVGTVGVLPMMSSIVSGVSIPGFIIRLRKEVPVGQIKCAFGQEPKKGEHILVVSDVLTTGGGFVVTKKILAEYNVNVSCGVVLYDREQNAREKLRKLYKVKVEPVTTASELLKAYKIPKKDYNFGVPEAEIIPPSSRKTKKLEDELKAEVIKRLKSVKPLN